MAPEPFIQAVVFDFDGVIADSEPAHERSMLDAAAELGLSFSPREYRETIIGYDDRDAFRVVAQMRGRTLTAAEAASLADDKQRRFEAMLAAGEVTLFPGSAALVRSAAARAPVAICSGAIRSEIEPLLAQFGLEGLIRTIVSADDVPVAKPDPAGYRLTAERLGVPTDRCVALEDTPTGIQAARGAGYARLVGVCHSVSAEELGAVDLVAPDTGSLTADDLLGFNGPTPTG
ncbi:MAG: HAD family phosphatase [Planctomycetota bacterium]